MYGSWDMEHKQKTSLSFWAIFCSFTPLTPQKIKILKKWKENTWRYHDFTQILPKIMIICYTVSEIWHVTGVIFIFHFRLFCPFTTLTNQKIKIFKTWRKYLEISSFYACVSNIMITLCTIPEIRRATDEQINK